MQRCHCHRATGSAAVVARGFEVLKLILSSQELSRGLKGLKVKGISAVRNFMFDWDALDSVAESNSASCQSEPAALQKGRKAGLCIGFKDFASNPWCPSD